MPCAVVVTYRDNEMGEQHSARPLLGDFAVLEHLETLRLSPLSVDGVAILLGDGHLDPEKVRAVTGGNAFFVTEVAKEPDLVLPATVRDAVLARTAGIAPADFEVLQLAATAPDRLDDRVLPALGVDLPTLRRLHSTDLLLRNRGGLVFRHELARLAIESTIPVGGSARLHTRLLDALERIEPRDPAVLTHHAVAAADSARATRYALEAADEAAETGAHTEAVAFLQTALSHLDGRRPRERASILTQLAYQQYMTSHLGSAIESVTATFPLWHEAEDTAGLSAAHESAAIFEYYNARRREAEDHADRATLLARESELEYGAARVTRGYLGLGLQPVRLEDGGVGAMVMTIDRDGPGAAAGVRQGDVIVRWNGAPIETVQALIRTLGSDSIGSVVALSILRAGEPMDLHLTIGERPQT